MKQVSTFPERFEEILQIRRIKKVEVAKSTGISIANLSRYAAGERIPKAANVYAIADVLAVSDRWLNGYDVPMEQTPAQKMAAQHIETLIHLSEEDAVQELAKLLQVYEETAGIDYTVEQLKDILRYCRFVAAGK